MAHELLLENAQFFPRHGQFLRRQGSGEAVPALPALTGRSGRRKARARGCVRSHLLKEAASGPGVLNLWACAYSKPGD